MKMSNEIGLIQKDDGVVYSIEDWKKSKWMDNNTNSFQDYDVVQFLSNKINIKGYMVSPNVMFNNEPRMSKRLKITNLNEFITKCFDKEILLYELLYFPNRFLYDDVSDNLFFSENEEYWLIRFAII